MKYFTLDWWRGDADSDIEEYSSYLDDIRPQLSSKLSQFVDTINLHDAQIISFDLDTTGRKLEFLFNALFPSSGPASFEHHRLSLIYEEVSHINSISTPEKALGGPAGYGDLGYDEIELVQEQLFEHRLLFSSGIELQIRFKDVTWQQLD
jgi:hypothetical protein